MGSWGPGVLESDDALDYFGEFFQPFNDELLEKLTAIMEKAEKDQSVISPEHRASEEVLTILDFLIYIHEKYPSCTLPPSEKVSSWKELYLRVWEQDIDLMEPKPDYKKLRRMVIVETFNKVERLSLEFESRAAMFHQEFGVPE